MDETINVQRLVNEIQEKSINLPRAPEILYKLLFLIKFNLRLRHSLNCRITEVEDKELLW